MNQNSFGHKHGLKGHLRPDVVAATSRVAKPWKSPDVRRLMTGRRMRFAWTAEHYSAVQSEILPFARTRLELEGVTLSERVSRTVVM